MKIVSVISSIAPRDGGPPNVALSVGRSLADKGHDQVIETTDSDGFRDTLSLDLGSQYRHGAHVCVHRFHPPRHIKSSVGQAWHIWRKTRGADVVHVHALYFSCFIAGTVAARARGIPYVIQPHGGLEPFHQAKSHRVKHLWDRLFGNAAMRGAAAIICASETEATNVGKAGFNNAVVIPHGVTRESAEPSQRIARLIDEWHDDTVVLFLGRLAAKKHPEVLVEAWGRVERPAAHLVIVGPDDIWTAAQLNQLASESPVASRIWTVGPLEGADKWAVLERSDLLVLPSDNENYAVTVPEGLTAGAAVLLTDAVATSRDVREAGAGWVVSDATVDTWAEALSVALEDRPRLRDLGAAARAYAQDRYNWDAVADEYAAVYAKGAHG